MAKIYELDCPDTYKPRYIGKTSNDLNSYLRVHRYRAKNGDKRFVYCWYRALLEENKEPAIQLVEEVSELRWREAEQYWINWFRNRYGWDQILNMTPGGQYGSDKGGTVSEETRRKISEAMKTKYKENPASHPRLGTSHSDEVKKKISKSMKGNQNRSGLKNSSEHNKAIAKSNKGNDHGKGQHPSKWALDYKTAEEIRERYENENITQYQLAEEYGVAQSTIGNIVRRETYTEPAD